jgi:hypothetical protein
VNNSFIDSVLFFRQINTCQNKFYQKLRCYARKVFYAS